MALNRGPRQQVDYNVDTQDIWFPMTYTQMQNLEGVVLTHIEILGLPEKQEKPFKDIVRQKLWDWYRDVVDNSYTAYSEKLHPIVVDRFVAAKEAPLK